MTPKSDENIYKRAAVGHLSQVFLLSEMFTNIDAYYLPAEVEEEFIAQVLDTADNPLICIGSCYSRKQYSWFGFF